jgi:hypothetical protein
MRECRLGNAATRSHDEIDMGNLVAFTDQRLADAQPSYLCHGHAPPEKKATLSADADCVRRTATLVFSVRQVMPDRLAG